jgi:hypothetical protein
MIRFCASADKFSRQGLVLGIAAQVFAAAASKLAAFSFPVFDFKAFAAAALALATISGSFSLFFAASV